MGTKIIIDRRCEVYAAHSASRAIRRDTAELGVAVHGEPLRYDASAHSSACLPTPAERYTCADGVRALIPHARGRAGGRCRRGAAGGRREWAAGGGRGRLPARRASGCPACRLAGVASGAGAPAASSLAGDWSAGGSTILPALCAGRHAEGAVPRNIPMAARRPAATRPRAVAHRRLRHHPYGNRRRPGPESRDGTACRSCPAPASLEPGSRFGGAVDCSVPPGTVMAGVPGAARCPADSPDWQSGPPIVPVAGGGTVCAAPERIDGLLPLVSASA